VQNCLITLGALFAAGTYLIQYNLLFYQLSAPNFNKSIICFLMSFFMACWISSRMIFRRVGSSWATVVCIWATVVCNWATFPISFCFFSMLARKSLKTTPFRSSTCRNSFVVATHSVLNISACNNKHEIKSHHLC
jgi:hypothetical protein